MNKDIFIILDELKIKYKMIEHKEVCTVEEAKEICNNIEGIGCKNLFLTDRKGKYILLILKKDKKANFKEIEDKLKIKKLSFASENELDKILGLKKGSCTPFGIINDVNHKTLIIIDKDLKSKRLLFHPNRNTATISIEFEDLIKFIEYEKNQYIIN